MKDSFIFEGKKYISAKRAATLAGYSSDYVGQLCRGGKLTCRMVGRSWFVSEESLFLHKANVAREEANRSRIDNLRTGATTSVVASSQLVESDDKKISINAVDLKLGVSKGVDARMSSDESVKASSISDEARKEVVEDTVEVRQAENFIPDITWTFSKDSDRDLQSAEKNIVSRIDDLVTTKYLSDERPLLPTLNKNISTVASDSLRESNKLKIVDQKKSIPAVELKKTEAPIKKSEAKKLSVVSAESLTPSADSLLGLKKEVSAKQAEKKSPEAIKKSEELKTVRVPDASKQVKVATANATQTLQSAKPIKVPRQTLKKLGVSFNRNLQSVAKSTNIAYDKLARSVILKRVIKGTLVLAFFYSVSLGTYNIMTTPSGLVLATKLVDSSKSLAASSMNAVEYVATIAGRSYQSLIAFFTNPVRLAVDGRSADYASKNSSSGMSNGLVLSSAYGNDVENQIMKQKISESFSDNVVVSPDKSGTAGVITPVFREAKGNDFVYVMVPVKENEKSIQ